MRGVLEVVVAVPLRVHVVPVERAVRVERGVEARARVREPVPLAVAVREEVAADKPGLEIVQRRAERLLAERRILAEPRRIERLELAGRGEEPVEHLLERRPRVARLERQEVVGHGLADGGGRLPAGRHDGPGERGGRGAVGLLGLPRAAVAEVDRSLRAVSGRGHVHLDDGAEGEVLELLSGDGRGVDALLRGDLPHGVHRGGVLHAAEDPLAVPSDGGQHVARLRVEAIAPEPVADRRADGAGERELRGVLPGHAVRDHHVELLLDAPLRGHVLHVVHGLPATLGGLHGGRPRRKEVPVRTAEAGAPVVAELCVEAAGQGSAGRGELTLDGVLHACLVEAVRTERIGVPACVDRQRLDVGQEVRHAVQYSV